MFERKGDPNSKLIPRNIDVTLGSRSVFKIFETGRRTFPVHRICTHPDFDVNSPSSDANIAVIFLESPVRGNRHYSPIGIKHLTPDILSLTDVIHVSHGSKENLNAKLDLTATRLNTSILASESCPISQNSQLFCIGEYDNPLCVDDIGSGLIVRHNKIPYLRGIVSSVVGSETGICDHNSYSAFTDVSKYVDWIENVEPKDSDEVDV